MKTQFVLLALAAGSLTVAARTIFKRRSAVRPLSRAAFMALMGLSAASAQIVSTYSVNNLGDLTGFTYPSPAAINNRGQVAGGANTSNFSVTHAFRTAPNSPINPSTDDLGLLPGATSASASGINNLGQVSGAASGYSDFSARAFRGDPGNPALVDLGVFSGTLSGLPSSYGNGINDVGQVTGAATVVRPAPCSGFQSHAFRTLPNGPLSTADDLSTLGNGGCGFSDGYAINASGQVAGYSSSFLSPQTVFLATPGMADQDLGGLGGLLRTAYGINNAGQVVGASKITNVGTAFNYYNAFLVSSGSSMVDLGTLGGSYSFAHGINSAAQIVGSSTTPGDTASHAFLYENGSIYDLNVFIPAGTGWVLENASAINDVGQIVGTGTLNGVYSAFRLDPVATEEAPSSGDNCNGTYKGTFNNDITVSSGQTCYFLSGVIRGNVKVKKGGNLFLKLAIIRGKMALNGANATLVQSTVEDTVSVEGGFTTIVDSFFGGNLDVDGGGGGGGSVFYMDPSTVEGNLTIVNLAAGSAPSQICGAKIEGNLKVNGNATAVMIGQGGACTGNTVLGNVHVEDNTAPVTVIGNKVSGNLQCSGNASITGSGNTASDDGNERDNNQCAAFVVY